MDLHTLQTKLKTAIQNHQIMVLKMRSDPQNISLQKHLHDLQAEIVSLSEKQKQVVEQLRKDIEQKQCQQPRVQRLVQAPKSINNNQVIIEFSTQNNNCKIVTSVASPIRVPHYQPALSSPFVQKPKVTTISNHEPAVVPRKVSPKSFSVSSKLEKGDFMAALGLLTKRALDEIQSKKTERKRRTTANPHFSNSAGEDRRRFLNPCNGSPIFKRPRGRPRLVTSPSNVANSNSASVNGHVPNGIKKSLKSTKEECDVNDACVTCNGTSGEFATCDSCNAVHHLSCVNLQSVPLSYWSCPQCSASQASSKISDKKAMSQWTNSLAVVHNLIALKSAKTEEKEKLMKRSLELKTEKAQLEDRVRHLTDVLAARIERHKSLLNNNKRIQQSVNSIQDFVRFLQKS